MIIDRETRGNLLGLSPVEMYKKVLSGELARFPLGYWVGEEGRQSAIACTRYLLDKKLKFKSDEVESRSVFKALQKYGLCGMLKSLFQGTVSILIEAAYPNIRQYNELNQLFPTEDLPVDIVKIYKDVLSGKRKRLLRGIWKSPQKLDYAICCVRYLCYIHLSLSDDEILTQFGKPILVQYGLEKMYAVVFNHNIKAVFDSAFPHLSSAKKEESIETAQLEAEVVKLHELYTQLQVYSRENVLNTYSYSYLRENGLTSIIYRGQKKYNLYELICMAFPNEDFKPWEFKSCPRGYWNDDTVARAIRDLLLKKKALSHEQILNEFSINLLENNKLKRVLSLGYSLYDLLELAYPNEFTKEEVHIKNNS